MIKFKYGVESPDGDVYFKANDKSACEEYIEYWQSATGHDKSSSDLRVVEYNTNLTGE